MKRESTEDDDDVRAVLFAAFDTRRLVRFESSAGLLQTLFVCLVLMVAAYLFGKDSRELVLVPIERMISKMHRIRDNPLVAMKLGDEDFKKLEQEKAKALALAEVQGKAGP